MTNPCNPLSCPLYASGYCEYDFATGQIMPMDSDNCPLIKEESPSHGMSTDGTLANG